MATEATRLLDSMQSGEYIPTEEELLLQQQVNSDGEPDKKLGSLFKNYRLAPGGEQRNDVLGMEAAIAGYGQSRYDDRTEFVPGADLEERRAIEQPKFWKIANGAIKGGVVAGTTAVETVAGVIDGLLEGAYELGDQIVNKDKDLDFSEVVSKGVNNFTARTMTDIQKMSEEWFPNYRTQEERSEEYQRDWLKHIFDANFIGDVFLKNFGFTVGAIGGSVVWSKAIGAALRASTAGNLMKGVTAAAEGNAEAKAALENSLKLIDGWAASTIDETQLIKNINGASKALNKMKAKQQLFGSVIGAMGEGTMEGVMARDEFMDNYTEKLNNEYLAAREEKRQQLIQELEGTDSVKRVPVRDENGNITFVSELNDKGEAKLAKEYDKLAEDYYKKRNYSEEQGDNIAATTFLLNLPILTISNTVQFGRLFSGGFKTARNTAKVAGGITKNAGKVTANYSGIGNKAARAIGKSLKVGTSEASEEMLQGVASSGAKNVADDRMTSFNDDGYDRNAMNEYGSWLSGMVAGGKEYLGDWKNWQEGFLGMVTGLIGMPGRHWSGGIPGAIKEANEEVAASTSAAYALNNRINSDKFQNAWKGYVRHLKYDNEMEDAIKNDDQYTWKTANDKQLINDIMMFADACRLQDLNDLVDSYANLTNDEAKELEVVEAATSDANKGDAFNNPDKIIAGVKDNAKAIKDNIELYNNMYNAMLGLAPVGSSEDQIKELIATSMNIRAFETRFLSMFDDVIKGLDKYIKPLAATTKEGESINSDAEKLERAKEIYNSIAEIYTGTGIPVDTPLVEAIGTINTLNNLRDSIEKTGDTELLGKIDDMKKVAADRKKFLRKMLTLRDLDPVKFEEQKETPDKVIEEQNIIKAQEATKDLETLNDVKQAYFSRNAKERVEFLNNLNAVEESNPSVKSFMNLKRRHDEFKAYLDKNGLNVDNVTVTPPMLNSIVNDLIRRAKTEDELTSLPDSVFPSYEEFAKDHSNIFGPPSEGTLFSIKQALRNAMNAYMGVDTATASRKSVSPTPVEQQPVTGTVSTPEGYDASQPASMEPAPVVKNESDTQKEEKVEVKQEKQISNATKRQTIPYEKLRDILTRKGRHDGDLREPANKLPDKWHEYLFMAVKPDSEGQRKAAISELIKYSEQNSGNAAADAVLNAIVYEVVDEPNDNIEEQNTKVEQNIEAQKPTEETLLADAADAVVDDLPKDIEKERIDNPGKKSMIAYLRTSMPETSTEQSRIARDAFSEKDRDALKEVDLSNFPEYLLHQIDKLKEELNKEKDTAKKKNIKEEIKLLQKQYDDFLPTWNALNDRGAFNATATILDVGDKIEFVVDPSFPLYNGMYQVLLTTVKDGQRITLNLLSRQTDKYYNLSELHKAIDDEYQKFKEDHPNELFVFSKKSNVWAKRAGVIDYDFSLKEEKGIAQIQGYSDDAPIAFIDRNGNPVAVRGDKDAANHVSIDFGDKSRNRGDVDGIDRRGNLYYLSKTDKDSYIPIRLNVEHFNEENIDVDNDVFNDIRKSLGNIADIVRQSNNTNLQSQNKSLHSELEKLVKNLDLNGIFFEIGDYENVGVALRINDGTDSFIRRPDQMTDEWLTNLIAGFDRSVQIKLDENGKIQNLDRYIENDILTSNARMLRQKGVDFYFDTWNGEDFSPATSSIAEIEKKESIPETQSTLEEIPDNLDANFDDMLGDPTINNDDAKQISERKSITEYKSEGYSEYQDKVNDNSEHAEIAKKKFSELSDNIREQLSSKGYSEQEWNSTPEVLRDKILKCL